MEVEEVEEEPKLKTTEIDPILLPVQEKNFVPSHELRIIPDADRSEPSQKKATERGRPPVTCGERGEDWLKKHKPTRTKKHSRFLKDLQIYQLGYPANDNEFDFSLKKQKSMNKNLEFYKGERRSRPDNCKIEEFHKDWKGEYKRLEFEHGFIQWLFPIREQGLNWEAQKLYPHEKFLMKTDPIIKHRIINSYKLMLDFYGMKLDEQTCQVSRSENYKPRYRNLNQSFHNNLRITRILKCLGEMDLEKYKMPFLLHCLEEMIINRELVNCKESCVRFWCPTLMVEKERTELMNALKTLRNSNKQMKEWILEHKAALFSVESDEAKQTQNQKSGSTDLKAEPQKKEEDSVKKENPSQSTMEEERKA